MSIDDTVQLFNVSSKTTLYIANCNNVTIYVSHKLNHIVIENCNNVKIKIKGGLISGIDILRSQHIFCDVGKTKIFNAYYYISKFCTMRLHETVSDVLINTQNSENIIFELVAYNTFKKYITNQSLFSELTYFTFLSNDEGKYLTYANICSSGIIYSEQESN